MATYTLKFYRYKDASSSVREGQGSISFDVGEDLAAIRYAGQGHSEMISDNDYVVLWSEDGRLVKEWGSVRS
jgi:hypothetical protein